MTKSRFDTLGHVMTDLQAPVVRRVARAAALTPVLLVPLAAAPALAVPPEGWEVAEPVSALQFLLVLVALPLGLFAIITLLVLVPAMARGEKYTPGLAWRNENEWFGGPSGGVEAAEESAPEELEGDDESRQGGSSARW